MFSTQSIHGRFPARFCRSRRLLLWLAKCALFLTLASVAFGKEMGSGFVFYKTQKSETDARAEVREVSSFEMFPVMCKGTTVDGSTFEIPAGNTILFLPDPTVSQDPRAALEVVQQLLPRFPQHEALLNKLLAVCKKRINPGSSAQATPANAKTVAGDIVLLDGTRFSGAVLMSSAADGLKISDDQGIHAIFFEDLDLEKSTLPPQVAQQAKSFNNPYILLKKAEELLAAETDVEKKSRVLRLLTRAAGHDNRKAQLALGRLYRAGEIVPQNYEEAEKWTRKAADSGLLDALVDMTFGFSPTEEEASEWKAKATKVPEGKVAIEKELERRALEKTTKLAATEDSSEPSDNANDDADAEAAATLVMYDQDCRRKGGGTLEGYVKALDDGVKDEDPNAMYLWVINIQQQFGAEHDARRNFMLLQMAAQKEHTPSQVLLAECYLKGTGCEQNTEEAIRWMREAATLGSAEARRKLKGMSISGGSIPGNHANPDEHSAAASHTNGGNSMVTREQDSASRQQTPTTKAFTRLTPEVINSIRLWFNNDQEVIEWIESRFARVNISNEIASQAVSAIIGLIVLRPAAEFRNGRIEEVLKQAINEYIHEWEADFNGMRTEAGY